MSQQAKERWDKMYKDGIIPRNKAVKIVKKYASLAKGKKALEIACGWGGQCQIFSPKRF